MIINNFSLYNDEYWKRNLFTNNSGEQIVNVFQNIDSEIVGNLVESGMSDDNIVDLLLNFTQIDDTDEELLKKLTQEFETLVEETRIEIEDEQEAIEEAEDTSKETESPSNTTEIIPEVTIPEFETGNGEKTTEPSIPDVTTPKLGKGIEGTVPPQTPILTPSPISTEEENWSLEDTGNLFTAGINKENFLNEYTTLLENNNGENPYLNSLKDIGAENFFNTLDVNGDNVLDEAEIAALTSIDEDANSISAEEFNNIYNKTLENNPELGGTIPPEQAEGTTPTAETTPTDNASGVDTPQSTSPSSNGNSGDAPVRDEEPKETVEDLQKQRNEIEQEYDNKIDTLNQEMDTLIADSDISDELKEDYEIAKTNFDDNEEAIEEQDKLIAGYDTDIHDVDRSIAATKGELSELKTDTDDPEINAKNQKRKTELESNLAELENQKEELEDKKADATTEKERLEGLRPDLQSALDTTYAAILEAVPEETKTRLEEIKSEISTLETEKASKLNEIDAKIEVLKQEEIKESENAGKTLGRLASNETSAQIVETALKYLGDNEKDGSYRKFYSGYGGWCADFVTYVIKEVCREAGMSEDEIDKVDKHLGASPQKLTNRNSDHYYDTRNMSNEEYHNFVSTQLQPGMVFIMEGSGQSGQHTGFVAEVYPDGTFLTIEGNSSDMVKQNRRNISDMYGFIDMTYLVA